MKLQATRGDNNNNNKNNQGFNSYIDVSRPTQRKDIL